MRQILFSFSPSYTVMTNMAPRRPTKTGGVNFTPMKLTNDFDKDELAYWYTGHYACFWCGQSHADCFHHALGRETNHILSAIPINNNECHLPHHGIIRTDGNIRFLLQRALRHLISKGYVITEEKDGAYFEKYKRYYLS